MTLSALSALPPPTVRERVVYWARAATMVGLAVSAMIHLLMWVVALAVQIQGAQAGGAGPGQGIDVAVVTSVELAALEAASLEAASPGAPDVTLPDLPSAAASLDEAPGQGLSSLLEGGLGDIGAPAGAGDISGGNDGLGSGGAGGGSASFFGVEARGTRFAYIVDVSGSMTVGPKMDSLRNELVRSVESLSENTKFFICTFSSTSRPLGDREGWTEASPSGKRWARNAIASLAGEGGTVPIPAFQTVFQVQPKPDAIYFMTDGEFNAGYVFDIARLNADFHVPIHCITFVSRDGEQLMRKIAEDSGGTYTHVEGPGG